MKIYASSSYYSRFVSFLCDTIPDFVVGESEIERFPNGEMYVTIRDGVDGEECLVIGSAAPPDEQLLALLMLVEVLKHNGAKRVLAVLPYLGYARQDKFGQGEGGGIALIGTLLKAAGVDEIITFDVHSELDKGLIGLPLRSLSPARLFADALVKQGWVNPTIVAPDEGALGRCQALAEVLGIVSPVAFLVKRHIDGIVHLNLVGSVGSKVLLVDDIIDSGHTLISACKILRKNGVKEIAIAVTHGLFTGLDWPQLFNFGVTVLYVSDSCPRSLEQKYPKLGVVQMAPLLSEVLLNVTRKEKQHEGAAA